MLLWDLAVGGGGGDGGGGWVLAAILAASGGEDTRVCTAERHIMFNSLRFDHIHTH